MRRWSNSHNQETQRVEKATIKSLAKLHFITRNEKQQAKKKLFHVRNHNYHFQGVVHCNLTRSPEERKKSNLDHLPQVENVLKERVLNKRPKTVIMCWKSVASHLPLHQP